METYKLENFKRHYGVDFPDVTQLTPAQREAVVEKLKKRFGLPSSASDLEVVRAVDAAQEYLPGLSAVDHTFDILSALPTSAASLKSVLLNWYRYDEVDRIDLKILVSFFSDLWYPGSDDIDILDEEVSWVVSIRHDGAVKRVMF